MKKQKSVRNSDRSKQRKNQKATTNDVEFPWAEMFWELPGPTQADRVQQFREMVAAFVTMGDLTIDDHTQALKLIKEMGN